EPVNAEFGGPQWVFRNTTYAFAGPGRIACSWIDSGSGGFGVIEHGRLTSLENGLTSFDYVAAREGEAWFVAGSPTEPLAVMRQPLDGSPPEVVRRSSETAVDASFFSEPQTIEVPTEGQKTAWAFYYPPLNPDFGGPGDESPPLLVHSHGGPTSAFSTVLNLQTQYWTSRGWA